MQEMYFVLQSMEHKFQMSLTDTMLQNCLCLCLLAGFAGAGHCSICCSVGQGKYKDQFDGEGGLEPLVPILECVSPEVNNTGYIAWFGYTNYNPHNVYLAIGPDNRFEIESVVSSSAAVEDMGQPTKFAPGNHTNVFSIRWVMFRE